MASKQAPKALFDLQIVLARLAAPAAEQRSYLEQLGVFPSIDELALEFDDVMALVPQLVGEGHLTDAQTETMHAIDQKLSEMSKNPLLWEIEALAKHPDWEEIRNIAIAASEDALK